MSCWRPLLEGSDALRAREAIVAIAAQLEAPLSVADPVRAASLADGHAGIALFHDRLAHAGDEHLRLATEAVARVPMSPRLFDGFPGIAWVAQALASPDQGDPNEDIDEAVATHLGAPELPHAFDLFGGLVGLGVYGLARLSRPGGKHILREVVRLLDESSERTGDGLTWGTDVSALPKGALPPGTRAHYNLGLAHGLPGVIAFLARVHAAGIERERVERMLEGSVRWLLARRMPPGAASWFPGWYEPGTPPIAARSGWCYGDAGVAAALIAAARAVGRAGWEQEARRVALHAACCPPEGSRVVDAGICHGAAGLGHIFNRLWQATGEPALAQAAREWFHRALAMQGAHGSAGFAAWLPIAPGGEFRWVDEPGFLSGAAGVGLSLLAALGGATPSWDGVLLLDLALDAAPAA